MRRILAALFIGLLASTARPAHAAAPAFDATALKIIPLFDVLRRRTGRDRHFVDDDSTRDETLARVAALPSHVQTLFWLLFLEDIFEEPSKGENDALYYFVWFSRGRFAPQVREALLAAGMTRDAAIVAQAMGLFHLTYPLDEKVRSALWPGDKARFDESRLRSLAATFDERDALVRQILAYVAQTPDVAAWADRQRAAMTKEQRMDALVDRLWRLPGATEWETIRNWPAPYRNVLLVHLCDFNLEDGEFSRFFRDADGPWAAATADAYRAIGLPELARPIEAGLALFPRPYPSSRHERWQLEAANDGALRKQLDDIEGPLGDNHDYESMLYAEREGVLPN